MEYLFSAKPSNYLHENESLCHALESHDLLETKTLIGKFKSFLTKDQQMVQEGIVSIVSRAGNGKSFFLGLLYCNLFQHGYMVYYMDILEYITSKKTEKFFAKVKNRSHNDTKTPIILIDNIEKQPSERILDFFYVLNQYAEDENVLFVLAYDYGVIVRKLNRLYGQEFDVNLFFHRSIDMEFYLLDQIRAETTSEKLRGIVLNELNNNDLLLRLMTTLYEQNYINLSQLGVLIKKIKYFLQQFDSGEFEEKIPTALYLIVLKLICKEAYEKHVFKHIQTSGKKCPNQEQIINLENVFTHFQQHPQGLTITDDSLVSEVIKILEL